MDSEGSCDTEDWSNDAENSACFYCIFYQINAALVRIRDFFLKMCVFIYDNIYFYSLLFLVCLFIFVYMYICTQATKLWCKQPCTKVLKH